MGPRPCSLVVEVGENAFNDENPISTGGNIVTCLTLYVSLSTDFLEVKLRWGVD